MKIAVVGCCHGELDKIYETLADAEKENSFKVDLLIICGDFQAIRNMSDMEAMACSPKYRKLNTFWKYYKGDKEAPVLTLFIGGNHEASNFLQELPYGGYVAKNIYYFGYAGVVQFGGLRIAGLSGIFNAKDYHKGHFERPPYDKNTLRSVYHVRNLEVFRLSQISRPIDICLSHDWPLGMYNFGDVDGLLRRKRFFREDIEKGELGSGPTAEVLFKLKPKYWFSAHLHCKFVAMVEHEDSEITKFLALDKCLPNRDFLQVIDVPHDPDLTELQLEIDPEWFVILRSTNHLLSLSYAPCFMPGPGSTDRYDFTVTKDELTDMKKALGILRVPDVFEHTGETHQPSQPQQFAVMQMYRNPQTELLCETLGLTDPYAVFLGLESHSTEANVSAVLPPSPSPKADESQLNEDVESSCDEVDEDDNKTTEFPSFVDSTAELSCSLSTSTSDSYYVGSTQGSDSVGVDSQQVGGSSLGNPDEIEQVGGSSLENPDKIELSGDEKEAEEDKSNNPQEADTNVSCDSLSQSYDSDEVAGTSGHGTDSSVDRDIKKLTFKPQSGGVVSSSRKRSKIAARFPGTADQVDVKKDEELMPPPGSIDSPCVQTLFESNSTHELKSAQLESENSGNLPGTGAEEEENHKTETALISQKLDSEHSDKLHQSVDSSKRPGEVDTDTSQSLQEPLGTLPNTLGTEPSSSGSLPDPLERADLKEELQGTASAAKRMSPRPSVDVRSNENSPKKMRRRNADLYKDTGTEDVA